MRIKELALDLSPLRAGGPLGRVLAARVLALLAIGLTSVGVVVQVYGQTGSSAQVGLVSLVLASGLLLGFLAGGVLADRRDRKGLILVGSGWAVVTFAVLAVNAAADRPALWVVYVTGALFGFTEGVAETALTAVLPALVSEEHLPATGALVTVTTTLGAIAGPMLGGLLIAGPGLATTFALAAVGTAVTTLLLTGLDRMPPTGAEAPGPSGAQAPGAEEASDGPPDAPADRSGPGSGGAGAVADLREGFRFVARHRIVSAVLVVDLCVAVFAAPQALFPELAERRLGGGPELVGLLTTAPMIGAALASLTSGWTGRTQRHWRVLCAAVAGWGLACIGFGLSPWLGLGLVFLALGGVADTISEMMRRTLLMTHTPDPLQGRVSSLWLAQAMTAPALGGVIAGLASSAVGPAAAVAGGGALCLAALAAVALMYRQLWRNEGQSVTTRPDNDEVGRGDNRGATASA
ncbi:MFS transporter [Streptomyces sp. NRRL F-2664]|uniref:MFS transporter n=1 Tax=Streptomyces sp. NRRL F-2664 TaxID=1463842 RepID=UPI00068C3C66|nr:MFS transporter [Streptomyces sp. NRRL F-2664]